MPSTRLLGFFALALAAAGLVAGLALWSNWDKHLEVRGRIVKARTAAPGEADSLVVLDLKLENPSELPFQVDEAQLILTPAAGEPIEGIIVAGADIQRVFEAYPALGIRANDPLLMREIIGPRKVAERMMAFQFPGTPEEKWKSRKSLVLKIRERQGSVHEIR